MVSSVQSIHIRKTTIMSSSNITINTNAGNGSGNSKVTLSLRHLMYLLDIHAGVFDENVHSGLYIAHGEAFAHTVAELIRTGLIRYEGTHSTTALGTAHVLHVLQLNVALE